MKIPDIILPLRIPIYRRIWSASLLSNFGLLIQGVGAAWAMTQLTGDTRMVALVQTASTLPIMLCSIPAGAIADTYDRRKIALLGLSISLAGATLLWIIACVGMISPAVLLGFCFLIGSGMALYSPAWQASVSEQVPPAVLPEAIAMNAISYNVARSFGPAIGGIIVAVFGPAAAFLANALAYSPLIAVLLLWRRIQSPSRLPPERVDRAIVSGFRYIFHSPSIRVVLFRTFLMGLIGGSLSALLPLVSRNVLRGNALVYGVMLGSFGVGAVAGALIVSDARKRFGGEAAIRSCAIVLAMAMITVGLSRTAWLTALCLLVAGTMWMLSVALFNVSVQTAAPRWVAGRVLAGFQASVTGGIAFGSWLWGNVAQEYGISMALFVSGALMLLSPLLAFRFRIPEPSAPIEETFIALADPDVSLPLTSRSGPIIIELEYRIPPKQAREFHQAMQKVELIRKRNGAYSWSIARDVGDATLWTERFHCPTWLDYLRQRSRATQAEWELQILASGYHQSASPIRVRRMLERPFGSVRYNEEAIDTGIIDIFPIN